MKNIFLFLALFALAASCSRGPEGIIEGDCSDTKDNDADGRYDCDDDGCLASDYCVNQARMVREEEAARAKEREEELRAKKATLAAKEEKLGPFFQVGNLLVQSATNAADVDWHGAEAYCKGLSLGNKAGWRLPTQDEAVKIVESKKLSKESSYVMWTSTKKGRKRAVIVGISQAAVNDLALHYKGQCRARCVNGEPS